MLSSSFRRSCALLALAVVPACGDDGPAGPGTEAPAFETLTVDASSGWALVRLGDPAMPVTAADPATSDAWDLGFFATSVMLNGGAAGPGGVEGYCVCANAAATDAQVLTMTADGEAAAFESVTRAAVPTSADAWQGDALAPAIDGWYAYDPATHVVSAAPSKVWKVRTRAGSFAKLHVVGIEGGTQATAGRVTVEFAVQATAGAPMGEVQRVTLDGSGGRAWLDLVGGGGGTAAAWDIALDGWDLRVNGGVSGDAQVGAVLADESFDAMADAGDAPASVYAVDAFGGVFDAHPWYRYNLQGNHQIWPTYDVYLVRRGDDVWKVQLTGYYDEAGNTRRITFRYARLDT
jgi:hypothetical protein